jgi:hypothetical protein
MKQPCTDVSTIMAQSPLLPQFKAPSAPLREQLLSRARVANLLRVSSHPPRRPKIISLRLSQSKGRASSLTSSNSSQSHERWHGGAEPQDLAPGLGAFSGVQWRPMKRHAARTTCGHGRAGRGRPCQKSQFHIDAMTRTRSRVGFSIGSLRTMGRIPFFETSTISPRH